MSDFDHCCTEPECRFIGQVTNANCTCHKSREEMMLSRLSELEAENDRLKERLAEMRDANSWMEREVKEHEFRERSQTDNRYDELINQIVSLEARLADARATALEEAAKVCDEWVDRFGDREIQYVSARDWASNAIKDCADLIRALKPKEPQG